MKPVVLQVDIARPAAEVFAYLADVENNAAWVRGVRSCSWTTAPPRGVGSRYEQVVSVLGREETRTTFEISAHEPGRLVTITTMEGSRFPLSVTRLVEPTGAASCRVTEIVESGLGGFYRVATPLLRLMARWTFAHDYGSLKRLLEASPSAS